MTSPVAAVDLSDDEKARFQRALQGEVYLMTARRRNYLILRLDSFLVDGAATYDPTVLTIEHVLPQTHPDLPGRLDPPAGGRRARRRGRTRLAAAQDLKRRLERILEGEAPCDIFVRWKPLAEQPSGWNPDLNDGVRLNIRPFMTAGVLRHNRKPKLNNWPSCSTAVCSGVSRMARTGRSMPS